MSTVRLFVDLNSQPSRAVHWAVLLLKVPLELHALRLDKNDTRTPEYLAIHPMGKVPAIQHGGDRCLRCAIIVFSSCCSQRQQLHRKQRHPDLPVLSLTLPALSTPSRRCSALASTHT